MEPTISAPSQTLNLLPRTNTISSSSQALWGLDTKHSMGRVSTVHSGVQLRTTQHTLDWRIVKLLRATHHPHA
jgi:hypothetical protein